MGAVKNLCNCGVVLERGGLRYSGGIESTLDTYMEAYNLREIKSERVYEIDETKPFQVEKIEVVDKNGRQREVYEVFEEITIRIYCISRIPVPNLYGYFALINNDGQPLIICDSREDGNDIFNNMAIGKYVVNIKILRGLLSSGVYTIRINFGSAHISDFYVDLLMDTFRFKVTDSISERGNNRNALTSMILKWSIIESMNV